MEPVPDLTESDQKGYPVAHNLEKLLEQAGEHYSEGDLEEAEALLNQARPLAEESGDQNALASVYNTLAGVRRAQGRMEEALELAERTLQFAQNASAPDEHLGYMYANVAQILNQLDRGRKALPYYQKAVELMKQEEEPDVASISRSLGAQADIHLAIGNNEEAEACLADALEMLRGVSVADHYFFDELAVVAVQYTDILFESGKADEALTVLKSLADQQTELFQQPENKFAVMMGQGAAAHEMIRKEYRANGTIPFNWLQILVQLKRAQHRADEPIGGADELPEVSDFECRIYTGAPQELAPKHERLAVLLHLLAQETGEADWFAAAEKHYRRALALATSAFSPNHPAVEQVLDNLRELYEDTGRDPEEVQAEG